MTPAAFVRRPERWIRELARKGDTGGTISVAPNFAFDHAAARASPNGDAPLDLSNVKAVLNGSEPISAATVRRFNEAFGPFGFPPKAIKPSYGLAEATLFVSTTPSADLPTIVRSTATPEQRPVRRGDSRRLPVRRSPRPARARSASPSGRSSSTPRRHRAARRPDR